MRPLLLFGGGGGTIFFLIPFTENNELNLDRTAVRSETDGGAMMVNALVAPSDDGRPHDNAIRGNKMTGGIMWNAAGALGSLKGDNPVFRAISVNK